jgi:hypothetical protein
MPAWAFIVIVLVVVVAVAAAIATVAMRKRRTAVLRDKFGPEYERTVESHAGRRAAESELRSRQRERAKLDIGPLPAATRLRYGEQWRCVQERFVDQPAETVRSAERLVHEVMAERGYPVGDFDAQSGLISVDHPEVVENYRVAHAIHERTVNGHVGTEELRDALLRYRSLFDELLRPGQEDGSTEANETTADQAQADQADLREAETVPAHRAIEDTATGPEAGHDPR